MIQTLSTRDSEQSISLWDKCTGCNELVFKGELERNFYVCPYCAHLFPLSVEKRLEQLLDVMPAEEAQTAALTGTISGYPVSLFIEELGMIPTQNHQAAFLTATHAAFNERVPLITVVRGQPHEEQFSLWETTYLASEMERLAAVSLPHITVITETGSIPLITNLPVGELVIAERTGSNEQNTAVKLQPALHAPEEQLLAQTTMLDGAAELKTENGFRNTEVSPDISVDCYISRVELPDLLGKLLKFFSHNSAVKERE